MKYLGKETKGMGSICEEASIIMPGSSTSAGGENRGGFLTGIVMLLRAASMSA